MEENVTLGLAFLGGLMSFISPCVLPLIPGYLSFISGLSLDEMRGTAWVNTFQTTLFMLFGGAALIVIGVGMGGYRASAQAMLSSPAFSALLTRERISPHRIPKQDQNTTRKGEPAVLRTPAGTATAIAR